MAIVRVGTESPVVPAPLYLVELIATLAGGSTRLMKRSSYSTISQARAQRTRWLSGPPRHPYIGGSVFLWGSHGPGDIVVGLAVNLYTYGIVSVEQI